MRLQKFLAAAGVASRRASERLIASGRVQVNGETVTDPARDVTDADEVRCDGRPVSAEDERVVYAVNKPAGVVCTASDPQGRRTVVSLIDSRLRVYPVGRLDIDTTGLVLLTNDGALAYRLTHPSFEVPRTYRATLGGPPITDAHVRSLRAGVNLEDGPTAPARVRRIGARADNVIELTIHEGRNRQVRRMCEAVGHRVTRLTRVAFGSLALGGLAEGAVRRLTAEQVAALTSPTGPSACRGSAGSPTGRVTRSSG
jgi:23S rRNA pseudouridine2605 synthase